MEAHITPLEATQELFDATKSNDLAKAKAAIAAGADPNAKDKNLWMPLHYSADKGYTELTRLLIDSGAEVNAKGMDQTTSLHFAAGQGHTNAARLLIDSGAEINAKNDQQQTPLYYAALVGHTELVELLLSKGADPTLPDKTGSTARQIADRHKHKLTADILAESECWHTHIKPLLGPDNKLDARQLVNESGQPTEALKNLLPNDLFAALAKPELYREGMDGLVQIYPHLPETVQASVDLTAWRRNKILANETVGEEESFVKRYVRPSRASTPAKQPGNDEPKVSR